MPPDLYTIEAIAALDASADLTEADGRDFDYLGVPLCTPDCVDCGIEELEGNE